MITIICGLIGAGKSTFAAENFKNFTDADLEESKDSQIKKTLELYRKGIDVAHITCFPTLKEECVFKGLKKKYIWINTPPDICKSNIKKRGRRRDLLNLSDTLAKNESIYDCYIQSDIDFDVVEIFETNERW
jgi:predicted kinase